MKRRAPIQRRYRDTGPDFETVMLVLHRDHYRCVRCGKTAQGERGMAWSLQHRKKRSAGVDNRACNLIVLCGSGTTGCHGHVEDNPAEAFDNGWAVSRYSKPEICAVLVDRESRWVMLTLDGRRLDPGEVPA